MSIKITGLKLTLAFLVLSITPSTSQAQQPLRDIYKFIRDAQNPNPTITDNQYGQTYGEHTPPSINKAREALIYLDISEKVYSGRAPNGWEERETITYSSGFDAKIYTNEFRNEAVLAFRGSELGIDDWVADGQHSSGGIPEQYKQAIEEGKRFTQNYSEYNKTLTGHSLGGGLATATALSTGYKAFIFDGIGINNNVADIILRDELNDNFPLFYLHTQIIENFNLAGEFVSDSDNNQDADVAGSNNIQYGDIYYLTNKRFTPDFPRINKTPLTLHYTTPLKEELNLLATQACRINTNPDLIGNPIDESLVNDRSGFFAALNPRGKCWTDSTSDTRDVITWQINYFINSISN